MSQVFAGGLSRCCHQRGQDIGSITKVVLRLRFLKLFLLALLCIQVTVFFAMCTIHFSYVRGVMVSLSLYDNETAEAFLSTYEQYCSQHLLPKPSNVLEWSRPASNGTSKPLCSCIPDTLDGRANLTMNPPQIGELELAFVGLLAGGSWSPQPCIPRQRVAVIIPFRDREEHLRILLNVLHPMMQRQNLHYTIFVVEQLQPAVFNKASLMNVGFVEARNGADYDCYVFHDVDMLPEDDRNFYVCSLEPRHVGSYINKWNYKIPYPDIFGGVTAFRQEHFERVNGFSNQYYGWGGEDDDMYNRIKAQNLSVSRFSKTVARYSMIKHISDAGNPYNTQSNVAWKLRPKHYAVDGLTSLRYRIVERQTRPLYTWLLVTLPPHPVYFRGSYRSQQTSGSERHRITLGDRRSPLFCLFVVFCIFFWSKVFGYRQGYHVT